MIRLDLDDPDALFRENSAENSDSVWNLPNRRLLWHGSRLSNFVGILSKGKKKKKKKKKFFLGIRIAPPEAPMTGYFLGKGAYFSDMSSKSSEYCAPNPKNPIG